MVLVTMKSATASGFKAQVGMFGGVVTIDETGKPVDASACTLK